MAKHELTEKQIAALQKLGITNFSFYRTHIPISMNNICFNTYGKAFDRLSKAIAVDVYTSPIGKNRFRECYDCFKKLNKRGKLGNTEVFLRLLDEKAQYYFGVLCGNIAAFINFWLMSDVVVGCLLYFLFINHCFLLFIFCKLFNLALNSFNLIYKTIKCVHSFLHRITSFRAL